MNVEDRQALIAGSGLLPYLFIKAALIKGFQPVIIALDRNWAIPAELPQENVHFVPPTSAQAILDILKAERVKKITFLGKISKDLLFHTREFDARALQILQGIRDWSDSSIMYAIIEEFEKEGFQITDQSLLLQEFFPGPGVLSQRKPDQQEWLDIEYGFKLAKAVASLDIGQTVVVKNSTALAIEAMEGTDEAILRGCKLGHGKTVIVKVRRPDQDKRFDIPAVGPNTIKTIIEGEGAVLAIEAHRTLLMDRTTVISLANRNNIAIVAFCPGEKKS